MVTQEIVRQQADRFLVPIQEYESPASRIKGFQELFTYGLRAPEPMFVVGHQAFLRYQAFGGITPLVAEEIGKAYEAIREANPERGAYIGRAFYVPGIDNPNGPRTAAIRNKEEYITEVTKFWDFVLENGYDVPDANIALILHPFIHVMDPPRTHYGNLPLQEGEQLPFSAGYLVPDPQPGKPNQIKILALFGTDEAVTSCSHDVYDVDPDTQTITKKRVGYKDETYVPGHGNEYGILDVPPRFQTLQALTDLEALTIAQEVVPVLREKPVRIEFATQADGIYFREIAPWNFPNSRELLLLKPGESIKEPIIRIATLADVERIKGPNVIVYFPPEAFRLRTTDLFAHATSKNRDEVERAVALVHGTVETSHMARVLSDAGWSVVPVGEQEFIDGTTVRISRDEDGLAQIELLNPYENAVIPFTDVATLSKGEAGQKVARLARMRSSGIPVPDGFALRSSIIWQHLKDIGLQAQVSILDTLNITDYEEIERVTQAIQQAILENPFHPDFESRIQLALAQYNFPLYMVRSSGSEDGEGQSRAGLYQSAAEVKPEEISKMVKRTIASYFSPASIIALRSCGQLPSRMTIGAGIHEFIPATEDTIGAVVFSSPKSVLIEATQHSPEGIVSGTSKDYLKITVSREEVTVETHGKPQISLSADQITEVVTITRQIEELFNSYQDIELLINPVRGLVVVQARPL